MDTGNLHPLARQAVVASSNPACTNWAHGITKYLAHDDSTLCIRWATDIVRPYLATTPEQRDILSRGIKALDSVVANPEASDLEQLEVLAWESWYQRAVILARLMWASMGVVELAMPGRASTLAASRILPPQTDHEEIASGLVWDQSAIAIQVSALENAGIPEKVAQSFTQAVCFSKKPVNCDIQGRVVWSWNGIAYEVAVLKAPGAYYFEFTDETTEGVLYSGPFSDMSDVDAHLELLKHSPKTIRLAPHEPIDSGPEEQGH